jgi:hypothetical protein
MRRAGRSRSFAGRSYLFRSEMRTGISQPRNAITVKIAVQTNNLAFFERFVSSRN